MDVSKRLHKAMSAAIARITASKRLLGHQRDGRNLVREKKCKLNTTAGGRPADA